MTLDNGRKVNPIAVLVVLALGTFMTLLDLTIVNVAIPSMLDGLHATLDQILWVLNAYSLSYAVLLITTGRLGDIFGPRNLFVLGMVVFTAASLLSGLSTNATELILARATQGLGAAILAPQGLPILLSVFPANRRAGVFAVFGVLAGLAVVAGPLAGGFIVTHFGWPWIFYVNLPIGVATIVAAMLIIPDLRPGRRHRLDFLGVALATAGLLGVVYGLIEGQRFDWGTVTGFVTIPEIIAAGVALLLIFVFYQASRRRAAPALRCLRRPQLLDQYGCPLRHGFFYRRPIPSAHHLLPVRPRTQRPGRWDRDRRPADLDDAAFGSRRRAVAKDEPEVSSDSRTGPVRGWLGLHPLGGACGRQPLDLHTGLDPERHRHGLYLDACLRQCGA